MYSKFDIAFAWAFGRGLRLARIGNDETIANLGQRVGLTAKRVGLIERGRCAIRASERAAFVAAFPVLAEIVPQKPRPIQPGQPAGQFAPRTPAVPHPEPAA